MALPAPPTDVENAVKDYLTGEALDLVARRHGVSAQRLRRTLGERGLLRTRVQSNAIRGAKTRARYVETMDVDTIAARYLAGESCNAIAKSLGVSRNVIDRRLVNAGIERRSNADANRLIAEGRTPEQNKAIVRAAHAASRGKPKPIEQKIKSAATREQRRTHVSPLEEELCALLQARGVRGLRPQAAIGPYNVDVATGTIAVEVFGGGWHAYGQHRKRAPERLRYILDEGWNLVIVWASISRWPIGPGAADYIAAFDKIAREDPTIRGQHRVIWGDGKASPTDGLDVNDLTLKPSRRRAIRLGA